MKNLLEKLKGIFVSASFVVMTLPPETVEALGPWAKVASGVAAALYATEKLSRKPTVAP